MKIFMNGTLDNMIERLCVTMNYVDKEWSDKIKPASSEQIKQLREITGFDAEQIELPKAYLSFLEKMGQDDGGLLEQVWDGTSDVNIEAIIEYYRDTIAEPSDIDPDPKQFLLFSTHWAETDLYLKLSDNDNPPVLLYTDRLFAASFENYLFQMAFRMMCEKQYPHHSYIAISKQDIDTLFHKYSHPVSTFSGTVQERMNFATRMMQTCSLQPTWFSDEVRYCCLDKELALMVEVDWAINVRIAGNDSKAVGSLEHELKQYLGIL